MAIPPPHAWINVSAARMLDATTLELAFAHPVCADPEVLFVDLYWEERGPGPDEATLALGLFERRLRHGLPACTGPVTSQCHRWALPPLLPDPGVRRGQLILNSERLYGRHRSLPTFTVPFELANGGMAGDQ